MRPKISVVIVTFNSGKVLSRAIESYISQDYENKELIIIDGNSTDNTIEIIKKYNSYINYWKSEPDNGIYDAMNKGWHESTGDYIIYIGSDDQLNPGSLSLLAKDCSGEDIIYGDIQFLYPNGKIKNGHALNVKVIKKGPFCSHQALMMKRDMIKELKGFDTQFKILGDYELILRAYLSGATLKYIKGYISKFAIGGTSYISLRNESEKLRIYKKHHTFKYPYIQYTKGVLLKIIKIIKHKITD